MADVNWSDPYGDVAQYGVPAVEASVPSEPVATWGESSVAPDVPVPAFQFESVPRPYRAKAAFKIAQQTQQGEADDADAAIQAKYLQKLQDDLMATRQGRDALRAKLGELAPRMPQTQAAPNLGESLAALLTGLAGHQWNQAAGVAASQAQARQQRDYQQSIQDWRQSQNLGSMDYRDALAKEKYLQGLIDEAVSSDAEQQNRLELLKQQGQQAKDLEQVRQQGRFQLADMKSPDAMAQRLVESGFDPQTAWDVALSAQKLALERAKAIPVQLDQGQQKIDETNRRNKAVEGIQKRGLDIREYAAKTSHEDRVRAANQRYELGRLHETGLTQRGYQNHLDRVSKAIVGGVALSPEDAKALRKTYDQLNGQYKKAQRDVDAAYSTLEDFTAMGADPKQIDAQKIAYVKAKNVRDAIGSDLDAASDAIGKQGPTAQANNAMAEIMGEINLGGIIGWGKKQVPAAKPKSKPSQKGGTANTKYGKAKFILK